MDIIAYRQLITILFYQEFSEFFKFVQATAVVASGLKIIVDVVVAADEYYEQGIGNVPGNFF